MNLLRIEMRRALRRRAVRVLILVALVGCVLLGVIAFSTSSGETLAELRRGENPAIMANWWKPGTADGSLLISFLFLIFGGIIGGATVAGAEWRSGTITSVLTWEPRRVRLHLTRTAACGILAAVIGFALQVLFLAASLPSVFANGSTDGIAASWWGSLLLAMTRASLVTALGAMVAVALATLGRNTAFALVAAFAWVGVIEGLIRGLKPGLAQYLWAENVATVVPWVQMEDVQFVRSPVVALTTLMVYATAFIAVSAAAFARRDIAGAS